MAAEGQKHDGPFRVAERRSIDEESDDGEAGGHEAQDGPDRHPHGSQRLVVAVEDDVGVALLCATPRPVDVDKPVGQVVAAARIDPADTVHVALYHSDAMLQVNFLQSCVPNQC